MTNSIVKLSDILDKAERDHKAGLSVDEHGFNWHATCLPAYLAERERLANTSHASHIASAARKRVEQAQGVA